MASSKTNVYTSKNILIIGEEDFSLSVAFLSFSPKHLVCTSLTGLKKAAVKNVQLLRNQGHEVFPRTDFFLTSFHDRKFDAIVFGFPMENTGYSKDNARFVKAVIRKALYLLQPNGLLNLVLYRSNWQSWGLDIFCSKCDVTNVDLLSSGPPKRLWCELMWYCKSCQSELCFVCFP